VKATDRASVIKTLCPGAEIPEDLYPEGWLEEPQKGDVLLVLEWRYRMKDPGPGVERALTEVWRRPGYEGTAPDPKDLPPSMWCPQPVIIRAGEQA
jgi:hypothetical protein